MKALNPAGDLSAVILLHYEPHFKKATNAKNFGVGTGFTDGRKLRHFVISDHIPEVLL